MYTKHWQSKKYNSYLQNQGTWIYIAVDEDCNKTEWCNKQQKRNKTSERLRMRVREELGGFN